MTDNEAIEVLTDRHTSIGTTKCDDVAWRKLKPAIDIAVNALEEIQQYRAIGTVEECREARERQIWKKPIKDSCEEKTHYKCHCGYIFMTTYSDGYRMGNQPKYCERCGQAISWESDTP